MRDFAPRRFKRIPLGRSGAPERNTGYGAGRARRNRFGGLIRIDPFSHPTKPVAPRPQSPSPKCPVSAVPAVRGNLRRRGGASSDDRYSTNQRRSKRQKSSPTYSPPFALRCGAYFCIPLTHANENLCKKIRVLRVCMSVLAYARWCPGADLNHRHADFQSAALPTELPGRLDAIWAGRGPRAFPPGEAPGGGRLIC